MSHGTPPPREHVSFSNPNKDYAMSKPEKKSSNSEAIKVQDPATLPGKDKDIGGSKSDDWNLVIAKHVVNSLRPIADEEQRDQAFTAAVQGLIGIAPQDELEGMLAAQLIASHHASMECYRRAMLREQTFEGRREELSQANKLSRTYTALLESLNRHRGKGQQKVTVEHVHVHDGGQAIVGNVESQGGGFASKSKEQPRAKQITHAPEQTMPSADAPRGQVPVSRDEERALPDARWTIDGRTEGES